MTDTILIITISLIAIIIGVSLGVYIQNLKTRSTKNTFEERELQLRAALDELRVKNEKEAIDKEEIRREKDSLAIQLTKKESDFENLLARNKEHKEEVERLRSEERRVAQ